MTEGRSQAEILRLVDNMLQRAAGLESAAEAESMAAMAQKLMTKYAINETMLRAQRAAAGKPSDEKIVTARIEFTGIFRKDLAYLATYVSLVNDCKVVYTDVDASGRGSSRRPATRTVTVVGFQSDVTNVEQLVRLLGIQQQRALNAFMTANYGHVTLAKMQAFKIRRQFIISFAHGVYDKLDAAKRVATRDAQAEHGTGMELALRDKGAQVEDALGDLFPRLREGRKRNIDGGGYEARQAGLRAGRSADVGQSGLGGQRQALPR
jgi:hypothetical protein